MFIEEYLLDLRRDRFTPRALVSYGRRVAARVRLEWDTNPGALRSVWSVALGFFAADFVAAVALALGTDRQLALRFFLDTALILPPAFALVSLGLGQLRDPAGFRLPALNIPLTLTLLRIALMPGLALMLIERRFSLAFPIYLVAGLTDIADGWIARRTGQITRLGTVLDPLVDIVFNLVVFSALAAGGLLPAWVAWVAAARYGILLLGGAYLCLCVGPLRIHSTPFGRMSGVVMAALVALLILLPIERGAIATALAPLTRMALGVLMSGTVVQVLLLGWHNLREMRGQAESRGRVVGDVRWGTR